MTESVRKQKSGDQLTPGDWLAPGELLNGAAEVLHALAYSAGYDRSSEKHVHLVVREQGKVAPYADVVGGGTLFDLASDADLAELREQVERAQRIADIRAFADWLEANPWVPLPNHLSAAKQLNGSETDPVPALAKVREIADRLAVKTDEHLDDRTRMEYAIGTVTYSLLSWHKDGRPVEPKPLISDETIEQAGRMGSWNESEQRWEDPDPTGQLYTRADDEQDDPTPVSGARIAPHTGGMTDGGLVDETEAVIHVWLIGAATACGLTVATLPARHSYVPSWSDPSTCLACAAEEPF